MSNVKAQSSNEINAMSKRTVSQKVEKERTCHAEPWPDEDQA
jgi:hypothetical protein